MNDNGEPRGCKRKTRSSPLTLMLKGGGNREQDNNLQMTDIAKIDRMIAINEYGEHLTVYKYRDWGKPFHRKLLLEPSVYLSAPSDFEDPLDCKIPIRYDLLTDIEIFDQYYKESKSKNPY